MSAPTTSQQQQQPLTARVHEGKNAIVTGAARSIGEAIVRSLAARGANVCIVYLTEKSDGPAAALAKELAAAHSVKAVAVRADIRTQEGVDRVLAEAKAGLPAAGPGGRFQVDILVHSAAQFHAMPLEGVTADDFHAVYASNVLGPILLTQACRPHLPTDRSGRIVSLSSVGSKIGMAGLTLYGGTKGALEAMTRTWARELAESCTVNAVSVGSTMTDMLALAPHEAKAAISQFYPITPLAPGREFDSEPQRKFAEQYGGRAAYPEEIAGVVAMICSPESRWMTGSLVAANGGLWMSS